MLLIIMEGVRLIKGGIIKMKKRLIALMLCLGISSTNVLAANLGVCSHMGLGYNYDNIANVKSAGTVEVDWVRDECRWDYMQNGVNGTIQMRSKDLDYIKRVDAAGINQLLVLSYGNASYGVAADTVFPKQDNPTYYNGYLNYVRYTVSQVKDYVEAYEIWNEPNVESFNYNLEGTAEDYAKLYLDAKAIINELDPTAKVLCGAIAGTDTSSYIKNIFNYVKTKGDVNTLVDAFSFHTYTHLDDEKFISGLSSIETVLDACGYNGDVWLTEFGATADGTNGRTEAAQPMAVAKHGIHWENYLKTNGREGVGFWYDLRNEVGISDYEDNFGLFDSSYNIKPVGYAMTAYNTLTKDKALESVTKVKTKDYLFMADEYGYVAKYTNESGATYILYDSNENKATSNVELFGDVAYVYDCKGNIKETINNPTGQKSITMTTEPTYVQCVTYNTTIKTAEYDTNEGILNVVGNTNISNSVTVELLKGGEVIDSRKAIVAGGEYEAWFSIVDGGNYTVRVGLPEATAMGNAEKYAEKECNIAGLVLPEYATGTIVSYNAETRSVSISGKINNYVENQYVTILAIPASMDINNVDINAAAYVRQIPATNGEFTQSFKIADYYSTKMAIYLGGTGIDTKQTNEADVAENAYVYVGSLDIGKTNTLTATALVRNFAETEKEASIIVAQYSADNELKGMTIEKKKVPAKTYGAIECTVSNVSIDADSSYAKAFVWSDVKELVPLIDLKKIELN